MRAYKPVNHRVVRDLSVREALRSIDQTLRQLSYQAAAPPVDLPDTSVGNMVRSIEATTKRSGDIKLNSSSSILPSNSSNNFSFALTAIPSGVLPPAHWKATNTYTYATAAAAGTATTFARSDDVLKFPHALMPSATTKTLTITDDGTEGCLLTAASTFSANALALLAPNATNALRVGKYGNLAVGGVALTDTILFSLTKQDFNEAIATPVAASYVLTNTNIGSGTAIAQAISISLTGTCTNAAAPTTRTIEGARINITAGAVSHNNFTGSVMGYRFGTATITAQTVGTSVVLVCGFEHGTVAAPLTATRVAITDYMGFRARMGATLLTSAAITNATGFRCEAITAGTNRYGVDIAAITTGTPTVSYGVQVATHSVGTTRRSVIGGNTLECTANDFYCSTAAKGLLVKDAQGTPEYWRIYPSATGTKDATWATDADGFASFTRAASATGIVTLNVQDTGTTAPAT